MSWALIIIVIVLLVMVFNPILVDFSVAVGGKRNKGERSRSLLWGVLATGFALSVGTIVLALSFSESFHRWIFEPPKVEWAYDPNTFQLSDGKHAGTVAPLTNGMWQRLTESRISLDNEPSEKPGAISPNEAESDNEFEPKVRPAWVDKPPKRVGDVYRAVVASDPFSTVDECFEQLEHRFPGEIEQRLTKLVPNDQRSLVDGESLNTMGVTLDYIMREICREQFTESVESSVGEMKRVYVLMEFTPAIESHLLDSWQNYQRQFRIVLVAKIAALVLAVLAVLYGLLQFDTWTRGYYTRWLLLGVPTVIIAIAAVVLFVS